MDKKKSYMKIWERRQDIKEWWTMENATFYHGGDKRWLPDKIRWHRLIGRNDSDDLIFGIAELDAGEYHLLHYHEDASECYYVLEGRSWFRVDDEVIDGTPGTGIMMRPGAKHAILNDSDEKLVFFFAFPKPHYETILVETTKPDMGL